MQTPLFRSLIGFLFIVGVTALSWFHIPAAVVAISATVLVALHGKAATLVELSFGPLKAKLNRDLSEAEKLIVKLQAMAVVQAKSTVAATVRMGRFSDQSDWQYLQLRNTEMALRELDVDEKAIVDARVDFIRFIASDLGLMALGGGRVPVHLGVDATNEWHAIVAKGTSKTPDEIETYLTKWGVADPVRLGRINDMRWLLKHGDIQSREQFMRSQEAVGWE